MLLALKMDEMVKSQGRQVACNEVDSPAESPERVQPCQHTDMSTSDLQKCNILNLYHFKPPNLTYQICIALNHEDWGNLLQQQQETNITLSLEVRCIYKRTTKKCRNGFGIGQWAEARVILRTMIKKSGLL
jgi:hypothetical protein